MTPISIEIRNFLGIRELKFDFKPGVYVMVGRNGSGKSSFFEAVLFSLYGRGIRHDARLVKAYIRNGTNEAVLIFRFKRNEKEYEIIRKISEKGSSKAVLYEISSEGKKRKLASQPSNVNEKVEQILNIDRDTFLETFLIAQGKIDNLANDFKKGVRSLIMKMSGFYDTKQFLQRKLGDYLKDIDSQAVEKLIQELKSEINKKGTEEDLKRELQHLYEERKRLFENIVDLDDKIGKLTNYEFLYKEKEKLNEYKRREKEILKLAEKEEKAEAVEKLKPIFDFIDETEKDVQDKKKKINHIKKEIEDFERKKQMIGSQLKNKRKALADLKQEMEFLEKEKSKKQGIIENTREYVNELRVVQSKLEDIKKEISDYESKQEALLKTISDIEKNISNLDRTLSKIAEKKTELEKAELEWMAFKISENLEDGDTCPVCGSVFHKSHKPEVSSFDIDEYRRILDEYKKISDEITRKNENLKNKKEELSEVSELLKKAKERYIEIAKRNNELVRNLKKCGYYSKIEEDLKNIDQKLKNVRNNYEQSWKNYTNLENDLKLIEKDIKQSLERIKTLEYEIFESEQALHERKNKVIEELNKVGVNMKEVNEYLSFEKRGYKEKLSRLRALIENIEENLRKAGQDIDEMYTKLKELRSKKDKYSENLENTNKEIGKIESTIKDVINIKKKIKSLEKQQEKLGKEKDVINKILYYLNDSKFGDYFYKMRLKSILDIANAELMALTNGIFQFTLDENDEVIIKRNDRNGEELPIGALSGGERTLVSLALAIAISESFVGNVGALFIDEGFSALDYYNREKIAEILKEYENLGRVIIFITHFEDLSSKFANVIKMKDGMLETPTSING